MKKKTFKISLSPYVEKWEWVVLILIILFPLISFLYMDTNSIIRCGIDITKALASGNLGDYYNFAFESYQNHLMVHPPTYDFLFYLTVGIWESPIAIIELIRGESLQGSALAMGYSKLLLLVFLLMSAYVVRKIALEIGLSSKNSSWTAFAFMSSGFVYAYLCITGQYDILGIFFTLVGVYYYIKKDMVKFTLVFAIAIQYKFFPLFIFIPLLLLKQKNLLKIAMHMVCVVIPLFVLRIPFLNDTTAMVEKDLIQADMVDRIFRNRIPIFETEVPLSLLLVGAVCIFCYLKNINDNEYNYYAIFVPFWVMAMLFLSFPFFPYWIIYLTPWLALLFFMRTDNSKNRFLFETGMVVSVILAQFSHFDYVFELERNTKNMFMDKFIFPYENFTNPLSLSNFNAILPIDACQDLLFGFYILFLVTLIILYWPKSSVTLQTDEYPCRKVLWSRLAIHAFVGCIPFLLYIGSILREWIFFR